MTQGITIPKTIHQIWIGHLPPPHNLLRTWKEKNPDYEYILWDEARIAEHLPNQTCQSQVTTIPEINGKADILRWEILYEYGGLFMDADSVCLESLPDSFLDVPGGGFSCFENEIMREGLIACGNMGFTPKHPLIKKILEMIRDPEHQHLLSSTRAWYSVGPGILTRAINESPVAERITIFPSHMFLPRHHTGLRYKGHEKIYAYQFWGTNDRSYDATDKMVVPLEYCQEPNEWVSVFVTSYNTLADHVFDCLQSIQRQIGYFGIELVWVNDGSTPENSETLREYLRVFQETSRFTRIQYLENPENWGCRRSLRRAVEACTCEYVLKMDADDIMLPDRIELQLQFMKKHNVPICGGQMEMFQDNTGQVMQLTQHPETILWNEFIQSNPRPTWFMNHPTLCFRRESLLSIGNYPDTPLSTDHPEQNMMDDYEIELKMLKKYGCLKNLPNTLLRYRMHSGQMTQQFPSDNEKMVMFREEMVRCIIRDNEEDEKVDNISYEITEKAPNNRETTPGTITFFHPPFSKSQPEVPVSLNMTPILATGYIPSHYVYI